MSLREKYLLICGNVRPEDDPKGSCGAKCPGLKALLKDELGRRGLHKRFRALESSCLDFCASGPTVCVMPDNVWYAGIRKEDIGEIIEIHLLGGKPVERLLNRQALRQTQGPEQGRGNAMAPTSSSVSLRKAKPGWTP